MTYEEAEVLLQRQLAALPRNSYPAGVISPYEYWGRVERIVDGDTLDVNVSMGFDISIKVRIRLFGVDTPEIHGVKKKSREYKCGQDSLDFVQAIVKEGDWIELKIKQSVKEKYGRWLALAYLGDGKCLNTLLIEQGYCYS